MIRFVFFERLVIGDWVQVVAAISSAIAAIVAVFAAVQSYRSAKQNNEAIEQMVCPRVSVMVRSTKANKSFIELVVLNDGRGLARNIKLKVVKDDLELMRQATDAKMMSDLRVFKSGIVVLPAGGQREYFILSLFGQYEEILKKEPTIHVEYQNSTKTKKYHDSFVLDFASLSESGWTSNEEKAPITMADELKKIRVAIEKIERAK